MKVSLDGYDSDADRWVAASPEESGDAHGGGGGGGGGEGASPPADRVRRMEGAEEGAEEGDAGFVDGSEPSSTSSDGIEGDVKTSQA